MVYIFKLPGLPMIICRIFFWFALFHTGFHFLTQRKHLCCSLADWRRGVRYPSLEHLFSCVWRLQRTSHFPDLSLQSGELSRGLSYWGGGGGLLQGTGWLIWSWKVKKRSSQYLILFFQGKNFPFVKVTRWLSFFPLIPSEILKHLKLTDVFVGQIWLNGGTFIWLNFVFIFGGLLFYFLPALYSSSLFQSPVSRACLGDPFLLILWLCVCIHVSVCL